ncbi:MAG: hypothetical protein IT305_14100 [Chloroflexi bacterium]|nr:hypothetical protein [Chloroflexota bacterium]
MTGRLMRRRVLAMLGGAGALVIGGAVYTSWTVPLARDDSRFPAWVATMPRGREAYAAAYTQLDLLATLSCYCGCMAFQTGAHLNLRDCFVTPASGEIEAHAAFCETCQDEAIDAVTWARDGVGWDEIHRRIITQYAERDPGSGGSGCSSPGEGEPQACT